MRDIHNSIDQIEEDLRSASMSDFDQDAIYELKNETQKNIGNLQNEFFKKCQFPFLVKTLFPRVVNYFSLKIKKKVLQ